MDFSAGSLFAALLVSSVGFGFFIFGKKQVRPPQLVAGGTMMVYPYFVSDPLPMFSLAAVLMLGLWGALRAGY
jgi:hypothetical protein